MRDHSMFGFLVGEAPTKTTDLELINEFAKQAASAYLGATQTPLNESISKIASVERLGPDQVSLVCQEANKIVNAQLFKTSSSKYVRFDLADAAAILDQGEEKTASVNDYAFAPREKGDFTFSKTAGHDGIQIPERFKVQAKMEKLAFDQVRTKEALIVINSEIQRGEREFVKVARNMLLPFPIHERRACFSDIACFCKQAGLDSDQTNRLMGLLNHVMVQQGLLEKSADVKADPDLISDNLNARIVNGTHPLYIIVKTLPEKCEKRKLYEERYNMIQEQLQDWRNDGQGAIVGQTAKEL